MTKKTATTAVIPVSPEVLAAKVQPSPLVEQARAFVIITAEDVTTIKGIRADLKAREKFIMEDETGPQFGKNIRLAHALHKSLVAGAGLFTTPINEVIQIIDRKLGTYELEQRRAKELAEQQAREAQDVERQKVLDAAKVKIDRAMKASSKVETQIEQMQAIVEDLLATEEARTLAARQIEVLRLQLDNHQDKAAVIQKTAEQATEALPVAAATAVSYERTKGVKVKKIAEVTDKMALIKAVAEGRAPESILDVNLGMLNRMVNMGITFPVDAVKVTEDAKYGGRG